jgi:hypothetical protein
MVAEWWRWGYMGTQVSGAGTSRGWVLRGLGGGASPRVTLFITKITLYKFKNIRI